MKYIASVLFLASLLPFQAVHAFTYDLGLTSPDIFFSQPSNALVEKQPIRIYSRITNYGSKDVTAYVVFYHGATDIIGQTLPVSVRAGGELDEVFVDWHVPVTPFVVRAEVVAADPGDEKVSNNIAQTATITPLKDTDGDGVPNTTDVDDDGDGVTDANDYAPLNPAVSKAPAPPTPPPAALDDVPAGNIDTTATAFPDVRDALTPVAVASDLAGKPDNNPQPLITTSDFEIEPGIVVNGNYISSIAITSVEKKWATYALSFMTNVPNLDVAVLPVTWDYGDGTSSTSNQIHTFPGPGTYHVTLTLAGAFGNEVTDVATIQVGFWSFYNFGFLAALGLLLLLLLLVAWAIVSRRKQKKEK